MSIDHGRPTALPPFGRSTGPDPAAGGPPAGPILMGPCGPLLVDSSTLVFSGWVARTRCVVGQQSEIPCVPDNSPLEQPLGAAVTSVVRDVDGFDGRAQTQTGRSVPPFSPLGGHRSVPHKKR